ncbi:MAG: hypothetical protein M1817_006402 [Caeruleum heppii]|nr:MAG: hypothetical protein M1817_006402 [Caeruleum heppii]
MVPSNRTASFLQGNQSWMAGTAECDRGYEPGCGDPAAPSLDFPWEYFTAALLYLFWCIVDHYIGRQRIGLWQRTVEASSYLVDWFRLHLRGISDAMVMLYVVVSLFAASYYATRVPNTLIDFCVFIGLVTSWAIAVLTTNQIDLAQTIGEISIRAGPICAILMPIFFLSDFALEHAYSVLPFFVLVTASVTLLMLANMPRARPVAEVHPTV